ARPREDAHPLSVAVPQDVLQDRGHGHPRLVFYPLGSTHERRLAAYDRSDGFAESPDPGRGAHEDKRGRLGTRVGQRPLHPEVRRERDTGKIEGILAGAKQLRGEFTIASPECDLVVDPRQVDCQGRAPAPRAKDRDRRHRRGARTRTKASRAQGERRGSTSNPVRGGGQGECRGALLTCGDCRGGRAYDSDEGSGGGASSLTSLSSSRSARRATETTRSPSSRPIRRTPCVFRPITRISFTRRRMTFPPLVTSMI